MGNLFIYSVFTFFAVLIFYTLYIYFIRDRVRYYLIAKQEFPLEYENVLLKEFHPYSYLSDIQKKQLKLKILYFLKYKYFNSIGTFIVEEYMKLLIAAQACLLIVNQKNNSVYPGLSNIYISETTFIEKDNFVDLDSMKPHFVPRIGESWRNGPVVLSWDSVKYGLENWKSGSSVVLHEFAHQLDSLDGGMDGTPILDAHNSYKNWERIMTKNFVDLRTKAKKYITSDIDFYGASNEAEFFAVTVENFFQKSKVFSHKHPELYNLYKLYFGLDPVRWE